MRRSQIALAVAVLALLPAACGNSGGHATATATAVASKARSAAPCKLDRAQRRAVARALADIRRLRRIEASMQAFSQHGAPNQNALTGKVMMDLGSAKLPLDTFSDVIHRAKAAVRLCGDCSVGLESEEPVLGNRAGQFARCRRSDATG